MKASPAGILVSLLALGVTHGAQLAHFAPASSVILNEPWITGIQVEDTNVVVTAQVPAGYYKVTIEGSDRVAGAAWLPKAVARPNGQSGQLTFRLALGSGVELLRLRADQADPLPDYFYSGASNFEGQPASDGVVAGTSYFRVLGDSFATLDTAINVSPVAGGNPPRAVLESDIWKLEGDTLYFFNQLRGLQVIDVSRPDEPRVTGTLPLSAAGEQMYVLNDQHVVLLARDGCSWSSTSDSRVIIVEIVGGIPVQVAAIPVSGSICESRVVGSGLYVASRAYRYAAATNSGVWESGTVVASYDLADPRHPVARSTEWIANGYNAVVAATERFLFVAREPDSNSNRESPVSVFDISQPDGTMALVSTIRPAGRVNDKFKLNLSGDILSVVSETGGPATFVETFSLANPGAPAKLGVLKIIEGETLYATRFDGERLYAVTFRQVDPLWLVDLTDPRAPRITGELQVPGFSTYLAPLGDRLLAIGRDTTSGWKTTVSLFDVADPGKPGLLNRVDLGSSYSYSEANDDEKALGLFPEQGLILVPFTTYASNRTIQAVQLIDLHPDSLKLRGRIEHPIQPRRATVHRDRILSLSGRELLSVDATDRDHPVVRATTLLSWPVDQVFLSGDFLIELSRAEAGGPVLRIAATGSPDQVLGRVVLTNLPFLGATHKEGRLYVAQGTPSEVWYEGNPVGTHSNLKTNWGVLCVTVLDMTQLPEVPVLGQVTQPVDQRHYGRWTPLWPSAELLVWCLTGSGDYGPYYGPYLRPVPLVYWGSASPGIISFRAPTGVLVGDSARLIPSVYILPRRYDYWGWGGEQRFIAFDVSDPRVPAMISDVNLGASSVNGVGQVFAADRLIYSSHREYASVVTGTNYYWTTNFTQKAVTNTVTVTNITSIPHYTWMTNVEPVTQVTAVRVLNRPDAFQSWQAPAAAQLGMLSAGGSHSLLATPAFQLLAWGANGMGQLGNGSYSGANSQLVPVAGAAGVIAVAAGLWHSLALKQDGSVWAWGFGYHGQLGGGEPAPTWPPVPYQGSPIPAPVIGVSNAVVVSAGTYHNLALVADGSIWEWGLDWTDTAPDGSLIYTAKRLPELTDVRSVSGGYDHSLALVADGTAWAWGRNGYGQIGGAPGSSRRPAVVPGLPRLSAVAAGFWYSLALAEDGSVYGWGLNQSGVLGTASISGRVTEVPVRISGLKDVVAVTAGRDHALALKRDGTLWAWGSNLYGQCADTGVAETPIPVQVPGCSNVVSFAAGRWYSLALTAQGELWGWGNDGEMQLGDGARHSATNGVYRTNLTQVASYTYETNVVQEPRIEFVYTPVVATNISTITATYQKDYLDVIDYSVPANPSARLPVSLPGALCGISHGGALLFTTATRHTGQTIRTSGDWLDASAYDGVAAHLVDSLPLTNGYSSPVLVHEGAAYVARAASGTNLPPQLEAWILPEGKFTRASAARLEQAAQVLGLFGNLLAAQGGEDVQLFDVSIPTVLAPLANSTAPGCAGFDLGAADGSVQKGLWLPLGEMGVRHAGP